MTQQPISQNTYIKILNLFDVSKEGMDLYLQIYSLGTPQNKFMVNRPDLVKNLNWTIAKVDKYIKELSLKGFILPHSSSLKGGGILIQMQPREILIQKINDKIKKYQEILVLLGQ